VPPRGRSGAWVVALAIAFVLAVQPMWPDRTAIAVVGAIGLTLLAATRWRLRWLPVVVLVTCAIALRLSMVGDHASDVADVTRAAIMTMQHGHDPYGIGYTVSRPPFAPFPYGPIALLWYAPFTQDPAFLELLVSIGLTVYFGVRAANGRPVGLAIFALAPPLVLASVDGSNDTSAGLLILVALVVAASRPTLGTALLAIAVAFKPYAIAWLPPLVAWAGLPALAAFLVASVVAWSPILFVWGPGSYLKSLAMAQETHLRQAYWSLGAIVVGIAPDAVARALETVRYFLSAAVAIFGALRIRSIDGVIVVGTLAFVIAQFGGYFGSYVYLAAIAPILCWRADDWLRLSLPELARAYRAIPPPKPRIRPPATAGVGSPVAVARQVALAPAIIPPAIIPPATRASRSRATERSSG
jgi:hypothetical protein